MWTGRYFGARYFSRQFFGPKPTTSITVRQVTFWPPKYFSSKYFSGRYFGVGFRIVINLVELESEDDLSVNLTETVTSSIHSFRAINTSDQLVVRLEESIPLFGGQGFTLRDNLRVQLDEQSYLDKLQEISDELSVNLLETAVVAVESTTTGIDLLSVQFAESATVVNLPFYRDWMGGETDDFYKDWTK